MQALKNYLYDRYKEYCSARGIDYNETAKKMSKDKEFEQWLINYEETLRLYKNHLSFSNEVTPSFYTYYECDKGKSNSVVAEENRISEHSENPSRLVLSRRNFYIISSQSIKLVQPEYKFLTFNPSNERRFIDFIKLHNDGNRVIFSVIGNNNDEDRDKKIESFNKTLEYLNGDYGVEADLCEDKYFYTFYSSKEKRKSRVKHL